MPRSSWSKYIDSLTGASCPTTVDCISWDTLRSHGLVSENDTRVRETLAILASRTFLDPKQPKTNGRWAVCLGSDTDNTLPTSQQPQSRSSIDLSRAGTGMVSYLGAHAHKSIALPVREIFTKRSEGGPPAKSYMAYRMTGVPHDCSADSRRLDTGAFFVLIEGLVPPETTGKPVTSFGTTANYALAVDGIQAPVFKNIFKCDTPSVNLDQSCRGTIFDRTRAMDTYEPHLEFMWPDLSTVLNRLEPAVKKHWEDHQRRVQREAEASKARASASASATATVSTQLNAPTKPPISKASTSTRATKPPPNHLLD